MMLIKEQYNDKDERVEVWIDESVKTLYIVKNYQKEHKALYNTDVGKWEAITTICTLANKF